MKSSIAAPSFRNSGLEQTCERQLGAPRGSPPRTFSAVPTGTVDLVTTTLGSFMCWPIVARHGEHVLEVGRAVLAGRRADGDEDDVAPSRPPRARSVVKLQPALAPGCARPAARARARRSGSRSAAGRAIFSASTSTQTTSLPVSARQAPGDQPDVAGSRPPPRCTSGLLFGERRCRVSTTQLRVARLIMPVVDRRVVGHDHHAVGGRAPSRRRAAPSVNSVPVLVRSRPRTDRDTTRRAPCSSSRRMMSSAGLSRMSSMSRL